MRPDKIVISSGYLKSLACVFLIILILPFDLEGTEYYRERMHPVIRPSLQRIMDRADAQIKEVVWVYFTDKHVSSGVELRSALRKGVPAVSPRARDRRKKRGSTREVIGLRDIPVYQPYIDSVLAIPGVLKKRVTSRWLNAISVETRISGISSLSELPFVSSISLVHSGVRREPDTREVFEKPGPGTQADPVYGPSLGQLEQINVIAAHEAGYSGKGVRVLMLDSGYYKDHEAINTDRIVAEYDFIYEDGNTQNEEEDPTDQHDHGTATMTALGAAVPGELYGPAYECEYLLAKTEDLTQEEPIEEDWYVAGLEWGERHGADVVSSSVGYIDWYTYEDLDGNTAQVTRAVDMAVRLGVTVVTAAGNYYVPGAEDGGLIAPADADSVISAGAVNSQGEITSFSSRGPTFDGRIKPEVVAQGLNTWCATTISPTRYGGKAGTSLSTPLVAGVAALLLEARPHLTPIQVREALMQTASNATAPNNMYGWGIVNAMAAIRYYALHTDTVEMVSRNYPNPFSRQTYIEHNIPERISIQSGVHLDIYNLRGHRVATFSHPYRRGVFVWDPEDAVSDGIYFYRLRAGSLTKKGKMTLIR